MASLSRAALILGMGVILGLACESSSGDERVDQTAECVAYVACMQALADPTTFMAIEEAYGPDGPCWANQSLADDCTATCSDSLAMQQQMNPGEAACQDGASDGATSG